MNLNKALKACALTVAGAMALACPARAAVVVTTALGPDVGPAAGESYVINFDSPLPPTGVDIAGNGGRVLPGSGFAPPLGDATPFFATPLTGDSGSAEIKFSDFLGNRDVSHFSFYWGSIDPFNSLQLFDRSNNQIVALSGATLIGSAANGSWTDPSANRRVFFNLTGSSRELGSLRFTSDPRAFEIDTLSLAAVPGPATWTLMIVGFGGIGVALRRRRGSVRARAA